MTTPELDRGAEAIYLHDPDTVLEDTGCECCVNLHRALEWSELDEDRRDEYRDKARACLKAMLPVSDAVVEAMVAVMQKAQDEHKLTGVADYFTAAITHITGGE